MAVLLDSGFLLILLVSRSIPPKPEHQATVRVLKSIREPIFLPVPAITEVAYLLARDIGNDAAADFISSLAHTELLKCPNGATAFSPGLPLRLPWVKKAILSSTATRLRLLCAFLSEKTTQPRCG
jgi:predicted nucleic acid-binding protein